MDVTPRGRIASCASGAPRSAWRAGSSAPRTDAGVPGRWRLGACHGDARLDPAASARRAAAFAACRSWSNGAVAHTATCTAWTNGAFVRAVAGFAAECRAAQFAMEGSLFPIVILQFRRALARGALGVMEREAQRGSVRRAAAFAAPGLSPCRIGLSPFRIRVSCFPRLSARPRHWRPGWFRLRPRSVADLAVGALTAPGSVRWRPTVCANHPETIIQIAIEIAIGGLNQITAAAVLGGFAAAAEPPGVQKPEARAPRHTRVCNDVTYPTQAEEPVHGDFASCAATHSDPIDLLKPDGNPRLGSRRWAFRRRV